MADDDRRAEIEAEVAEAIRESLWSTWGANRQTTDWPSRGDLRGAARAALDRVPDARGDDEAQYHDEHLGEGREFDERCGFCRPELARSPQDEDHEKGVMTDDERRAEIEAVAEALWDDTTARWSEPVAFAEANDKSRESYLNDARIAVAALDRVRDARGDDEAARAVLDRMIDAAARAGVDGVLPAETVRQECLRVTYALGAARSPQDEDDEGGRDG